MLLVWLFKYKIKMFLAIKIQTTGHLMPTLVFIGGHRAVLKELLPQIYLVPWYEREKFFRDFYVALNHIRKTSPL